MGLLRQGLLAKLPCFLSKDACYRNVRFRDNQGCRSEVPKVRRTLKPTQVRNFRFWWIFDTTTCQMSAENQRYASQRSNGTIGFGGYAVIEEFSITPSNENDSSSSH